AAGGRWGQLLGLVGRATAPEERLRRGLVAGERRQGAQEGVMVAAAAQAALVPVAELRRALMLRGDLGDIAATALREGVHGLRGYRLELGRPVLPMLAQPAG